MSVSYYNLEQTLEILQKSQSDTLIPFGLPQLADLCRRGELTPIFSYDKYIIKGAINHHENVIYIREFTRPFNGYLTAPELNPLLSKQIPTVIITNAYIYEEIGVEHLNSYKDERICLQKHGFDVLNAADNIHYYVQGDGYDIGIDDLLFPNKEIQSYISAKHQTSEKRQSKAVRQSKAPPPPNHIQLGSGFKQRTVGDLIKAQQHQGPIAPNDYQRITMLYDYFTPYQASCLIAGLHPDFNGSDDGLEMALGVIEGGIKKGRLTLDDDGQLNSDDLKSFLYNKDWVMTGFNDNLAKDTNSLDKENPFYQKRVSELERQLADAKDEVAGLQEKLSQSVSPLDKDLKEMPHQSMRTVLRVMYAMAKLTELDNSAPYGKNRGSLNCEIVTLLQNDNLKLEYQAVGKWLTEINEVQSAKR